MSKHLDAGAFAGALPLEIKAEDGDPIAEIKSAVDALTTDFGAFKAGAVKPVTDAVAAIKSRLDEVEKKLGRPAIIGNADEPGAPEKKAFSSFLRFGENRMPAEEVKSLVVSDDTRGGYLAPADFQAEVIKGITEVSPVRRAARVGSTGAGSVILPKRTGTPTASWVAEVEDRTETNSTYGGLEIQINESAAYVDVSLQLLEDSAVDVAAEVASDLAEEFERLESAAFVAGNGIKKPEGFMTNADVAFSVSGTAATIADADGQANGLITAFYALKAPYRNKSSWMMNGTTLASIRKLKDANKNYIWQPALREGEPSTLLGRPVFEATDMPSEGAGLYPIIFGDFSRGYRIYDRVAMSILRDPYTLATSGKVRFHARRRVGGNVVLAEALRKVKCSA